MWRFWPLAMIAGLAIVVGWGWHSTHVPNQPPAKTAVESVISLAPSITETIFAIGQGDRLLAVTEYCQYPPQAQGLTRVGNYLEPNLEQILALRPDLVVLLEHQTQAVAALKAMGIRTLTVNHASLAGIEASFEAIGEALFASAEAHALMADWQARKHAIQARVTDQNRPRVLLTVAHYPHHAQLGQVYVAGPQDFYHDLLELAGGENVFQHAWIRVPHLGLEGVLQLNPEVIIDILPDAKHSRHSAAFVRQLWQPLDAIQAVQRGEVHQIVGDFAVIPGPRLIELLEALAAILHPESA